MVRRGSAKPLFPGSNPGAASNFPRGSQGATLDDPPLGPAKAYIARKRTRSAADPGRPGTLGRDSTLAGNKRPSFLKSQKERQRQQRAQEKREARQGKRARIAELREAGTAAPEIEPAAGAEQPEPPVDPTGAPSK